MYGAFLPKMGKPGSDCRAFSILYFNCIELAELLGQLSLDAEVHGLANR